MMAEYKITERISKSIIDELLDLNKTNNLTPERIVNRASNPKSPLHNLFDWNDSIAATKWRLQQARVLVNEVKVIIEQKEYFAFENVSVNLSIEDTESLRVYKPVTEILGTEELRKQVIKSALDHLAYWERQNEKYSELVPIIKSAERVRKKLERQWQKKKK